MSLILLLLVVTSAVAAGILLLDRVAGRGKPRPVKRAGATPGEPVCGGCGYRVIGLESLACPECGGDLRRVGIDVPGAPRRTSTAAMSLAVLVLAAWSGVAFVRVASDMLPARVSFERRTQFRQPASGVYAGADVTTSASAWTGMPARARSRVELLPAAGGAPLVLDVDVRSGAYEYRTPDGQLAGGPNGFDGQAVLLWMKGAGYDITDSRLAEEAVTIAAEARRGALLGPWLEAARRAKSASSGALGIAGPGFATQSFQESIGPARPGVMKLIAALLIGVPWLCGAGFLIARLWPGGKPRRE